MRLKLKLNIINYKYFDDKLSYRSIIISEIGIFSKFVSLDNIFACKGLFAAKSDSGLSI